MSFKANWRPVLLLTLTPGFLALTGCSASAPSADPSGIDVRPPESDVLAPCLRPVPVTEAFYTDPAAQEVGWQTDRKRLVICAGRHAEAVAYITETLDLLGAKPE